MAQQRDTKGDRTKLHIDGKTNRLNSETERETKGDSLAPAGQDGFVHRRGYAITQPALQTDFSTGLDALGCVNKDIKRRGFVLI